MEKSIIENMYSGRKRRERSKPEVDGQRPLASSIVKSQYTTMQKERAEIEDRVNNEHITPSDEEQKVAKEITGGISQQFAEEMHEKSIDELGDKIKDAVRRTCESLVTTKKLTFEQGRRVEKIVLMTVLGNGPIQELLIDPEVTEIVVQRYDNIIIEKSNRKVVEDIIKNADKYTIAQGGIRMPWHVRCLMDEFANLSLPDDFDKILSVMRSRGVSVSIILQNLAQLKALFEKQWESIVGNTDEFVYLGGNEQATHKYVSELLGKETIDTNTYGKSTGRNGNYSTNYQNTGRELMTPDEVRMLDNRYALLFIRGERPVMDLKYDILKHPDVRMTTDGDMEPYLHGVPWDAGSSIELVSDPELIREAVENAKVIELPETDYELLSEADVEKMIAEEAKKNGGSK